MHALRMPGLPRASWWIFAPGGSVIARFFFIADPDGYQIEVLQRAGRYL
jgi:hypothetical protein